MKKDDKKILGFTLIELLVVVGILSVLAAVGIPWYQGYKIEAKEKQAVNNLQSIKLSQSQYFRDHDNYFPCPVTDIDTTKIDEQFFGGNGDLSQGAYEYKITGGCGSYNILATPKSS